MRRFLCILGLGAALLAATGCGSGYALRGKVVSGEFGTIAFVPPDSAELETAGVGGADVKVYRDPDRPSRQLIASGRSSPSGDLDLPLAGFGIGWMQEEWLIQVVRNGYETLEQTVVLPSSASDRRVLVIIRPGRSTPPVERDDYWQDYERFR